MIPMQIYRCDEDGFEYEVEFSVAEIEATACLNSGFRTLTYPLPSTAT